VPLPRTLFGFIVETGPFHQVFLCVLTIFVFLLELAPLELQRRIVNEAVEKVDFAAVLFLSSAYVGVVLGQGGLKLALNIYRSWVGERATRQLRRRINALVNAPQGKPNASGSGVKVSMVISEVEPVGGFVGASISEPLLQAGVLVSVLTYMVSLQPLIALATLMIFSPQLVFVPLMQRAINRRAASCVQTLREVSTDIIASPATRGPTQAEGEIDRIFELNMGIFRLKFTMNFLMNLSHHLQIVGALLFGSWCVLNGQTEVGTVVAFVSGIGRLNDPWGDLVNYFRDVTVTVTKYRLIVDAADVLVSGMPTNGQARSDAPSC
jgi:ABC-type multidrug transport system fused ATPase/permease subunit